MRFPITDEMRELEKIFRPYENGCHLLESAPEEAVKARNKYYELWDIENKKNSDIDLL